MTDNPTPQYGLTVLTLDYLITGSVPFNTELTFQESDTWFTLTGVEVKSMQKESAPSDSLARFNVPRGGATVALLPQKDVRQMQRFIVWQEYKRPLAAVFYAGPYYIQGTATLLLDNQLQPEQPVYDVRVTSRSGGRGVDFRAPFALLNRNWIEGFRAG